MTKSKIITRRLALCFMLSLCFSALGCATIIRVKPSEKNLELAPTQDHGVALLVRITDSGRGARIGESADFDIIIDGEKVDTIARNQRMKIAVPNGTHTIQVMETGGAGKKGVSNEETFIVNSDETLFHIYIGGDGLIGQFVLKQWPKE
jgi:archaellum component FlaF (FlaF/FlaG flagellin family)